MARGRLTFVTGIPGTGVQSALTKYLGWCSRNSTPAPVVISLENDYLIQAASTHLGKPVEDLDIIDVLRLPKPLLEQMWCDSFAKANQEITPIRDRGDNVILTFHAAWYHLANREYLSGIDYSLISQQIEQPSNVVTLMDDIYDVKSRLSRPRGLFAAKAVPQSEFLDAMIKLLRVLEWRNFETVLSRKVAQVFEVEHYILAIKHPIATFNELISESNKKLVYLAHPISQVRRLSRMGGEFSVTAETIMHRVKDLATQLRSDFIVLEPTCVDELRFYDHLFGEDHLVMPTLAQRWPLPSEDSNDILFTEPTNVSEPFGPWWEAKSSELLALGWENLKEEDIRRLHEVAPSLLTLQEDIRMQIKARDFTLVSQSNGLAVYRPLCEGHESGGVREEIDYHSNLVESGLPRATTVILHTDYDEQALRLERLQAHFKSWRLTNQIIAEDVDFDNFLSGLTVADVRSMTEAGSDTIAGQLIGALLDAHNMSIGPGQFASTMSEDPAALVREQELDIGRTVRSLRSYIKGLTDHPELAVIEDDLSVADFARRIRDLLETE